jgi:hypothetical protein
MRRREYIIKNSYTALLPNVLSIVLSSTFFSMMLLNFASLLYIMQLHGYSCTYLDTEIFHVKGTQQVLQRKYVALVIGTPRHSKGLLSAPLAKVCKNVLLFPCCFYLAWIFFIVLKRAAL